MKFFSWFRSLFAAPEIISLGIGSDTCVIGKKEHPGVTVYFAKGHHKISDFKRAIAQQYPEVAVGVKGRCVPAQGWFYKSRNNVFKFVPPSSELPKEYYTVLAIPNGVH